MSAVVTTYEETVAHFAGRSARAGARLAKWRSQPDKSSTVVPFVEQAQSRVIYELTPGDVKDSCGATVHALGDINKQAAMSVACVVDWHPSFAFQHVLHYTLEKTGEVPTYQEFRDFCATDAPAGTMLTQPARARLDYAFGLGFDRSMAREAIQWRVGNAYLSFMRELYVLTVLRNAGLDARYHVLADVLFRVDFWISDLCLSVFVSNPRFLSGSSGRKIVAPEVLADGPFSFARLELPTRHEYGCVHLPDANEILAALNDVAAPG